MAGENRIKIYTAISTHLIPDYFFISTLPCSTLTLIADRIPTTHQTTHTSRITRHSTSEDTSKSHTHIQTPSTTHHYPTHNTSVLFQTSSNPRSPNSLHPNSITRSGVYDLGRSTRMYGKEVDRFRINNGTMFPDVSHSYSYSSASASTSYNHDHSYSHPYSHSRQRQSTPATTSYSTPSITYRGLSVHVDREIHSSLPPSLEHHPFCRGLSSKMGQAQTKGSVELEVVPSTGPDPTLFRQHSRFPNVHISTPLNTSTPMLAQRTDEIKSRLAYSPPSSAVPTGSANSRTFAGIGLPKPGFGSKPKGLARKLSRKGPPAPIVTKKSMGPDPFEARPFSPMPPMEGMEGIKSQQAIVEEYGSKTIKAGSFPIRPRSEVQARRQVPNSQVPFPSSGNINRAPITPVTPTNPAVHRRVSSMTRSPRASIRSSPSKRAEREWRAKVAGLAHNHRANNFETRGPVPPRRVFQAPGVSDRDRSSSPEEDSLVTPVNSLPAKGLLQQQQENTPAKSFASNRSFETLGHYAHLSPTRISEQADPGPRQCSVPQSVGSSFYFDQRASRVSTHLSPLVNSATLSPIPSSQVPESPVPTHKAALPPFSSFHLSPASVGPPPSPTPSPHASPMVHPIRKDEDMPPLSLGKGPSSHSRRLHLSAQLPPLSPGPRTPVRQTRPATINLAPGTPYSPTTAHILQMDNVDLDLSLSYSGDQTSGRGAQRHPYARTPSMLIDSPPRKSAPKMMPLCPRHEVVSPPCRHAPNFQNETRPRRIENKGTAPLRTAKKVDLTPGIESGIRPPKSGLSMTVSTF